MNFAIRNQWHPKNLMKWQYLYTRIEFSIFIKICMNRIFKLHQINIILKCLSKSQEISNERESIIYKIIQIEYIQRENCKVQLA